MLPFTPKDALDKTIVGAFDLLPAKELIPTNKNDPIVPIKAATVACLKDIPKPRKKAPYDKASKETLAPAHGQKRERALPARSDSSITLGPFTSRPKAAIFISYLSYDKSSNPTPD